MSGFALEMFGNYSRTQKQFLEIIWHSATQSSVLQRLLVGYFLSVSALPSPTARLGFGGARWTKEPVGKHRAGQLRGTSGECWVFRGM